MDTINPVRWKSVQIKPFLDCVCTFLHFRLCGRINKIRLQILQRFESSCYTITHSLLTTPHRVNNAVVLWNSSPHRLCYVAAQPMRNKQLRMKAYHNCFVNNFYITVCFPFIRVRDSHDSLTVPHSNDCVGRLTERLTHTLVKHTSKFHLANRTIMQLLLEHRNKIFAPFAKRATLSRNSQQ